MKKMLLVLVVFSNLFFQSTPTFGATNQNLEYPDNQNMSFISEDEFYNKLDKTIYQEYKDAAFSIRQKISFKDVPNAELTFNQKTRLPGEKMSLQNQTHIHPNRQVYFMASFYQNEKEEFHKYTVVDAETKVILLGGNDYHQYENPYK